MIFETWQNWSQVIKIVLMVVAMVGGLAIWWQLNEIRKNTSKKWHRG